MITITTATDIRTWIENNRPDVAEIEGYGAALADRIQGADHPTYGADWAEWLHENVDSLVADIEEEEIG